MDRPLYFGSREYPKDLGKVEALKPASFAQLVHEVLAVPFELSVTRSEFAALPDEVRKRVKRVPFITPATFLNPSRAKQRNFESAGVANLVAIDIDIPDEARPFVENPDLLAQKLNGFAFAAHTTASATPENPKIHVFVSAESLPRDDYSKAASYVAGLLGVTLNKESKVVVQPFYLPVIFRGDDAMTDNPLFATRTDGDSIRPEHYAGVSAGAPPAAATNDADGEDTSGDALDNLRAQAEKAPPDLVRSALEKVSPDLVRGEWLEIAMGLKHQFRDDPETGFDLFHEWSAKGQKYKGEDDCRENWITLKPTPRGRAPVTIRTLFHKAKENGWTPPPAEDLPEIYYDNKSDRYYARADTGEFRSYPLAHARGVLKASESSKEKIEATLQRIRESAFIDYAINVSGKPIGLHVMSTKKVLVPKGPTYIKPEAGAWPVTKAILAGMFGGEDTDQYRWFTHWLGSSLRSFYDQTWQQAQVVALIGPPSSCKSLLQSLITAYFGGAVANVFQMATGGTQFNNDWAEATHLCVEDEFAENNRAIRARVQQLVKAVAVNKRHRIHPKGKDAFMIEPFWRMTLSCNPEPDSLAVLPLFDESVRDKISLLWTTRFPMPMPGASAREKDALWKTLMAEAPAVIFNLIRLGEVPANLRDPAGRFDLRAFAHPDAVAQVEDLTFEGEVMETAIEFARRQPGATFHGTAQEILEKAFGGSFDVGGGRWHRLNASWLGKMLTNFASARPDAFQELTKGGKRGKKYQVMDPAVRVLD